MKEKKAASPAISMVIITAATVVLVLIAGSFAVQVLDSQQAGTEFDAIQKSTLALDDAIRDVAWKAGASRSVRFTTNRGRLQAVSPTRSVEINFTSEYNLGSFDTSVITYLMSDSYITLGSEQSYILGNATAAVSSVSDSLAQVLIAHESGFASISLGYRLRISDEGSISVGGITTNYVNIYIIELSSPDFSVSNGAFDLVARNTEVFTVTKGPFPTSVGNSICIELDGTLQEDVSLDLDPGNVIFNLIISKVSVSA